jgi:hypothetical protein
MHGPDTILVAAPAGPTRDRLEAFLSARNARVLPVHREAFPHTPRIVIDQATLRMDGAEVLARVRCAIVLDSGMMWPIPMLDPTPEEWERHRDRFDDYLRDERETSSFWFSCLDILNDRVPLCINPQRAFALEATKLDAFEVLRDLGVPVAPTLCTNDEGALRDFTGRHPGPWLELSLAGGKARAMDQDGLARLRLGEDPVVLQAVDPGAALRVVAVGGTPIVLPTGACDADDCVARLSEIQAALGAPWLDVWLRRAAGRWVVSDFSPSARIDDLDAGDCSRVLEAVQGLIDAGPGEGS